MATNQHDAPRWPARLVARLGKVTDAELAEQLGVHPESVRRKRVAMRIPAYRREAVWTDEMDALLGTMPDGRVAKRLRVTPLAVRLRRHRLGIPARGV